MESTAKPEVKEAKARDQVRERATAVKEDLRELGRVTRDATKETASHLLDQSKHKYGEIEDQVVTYIREKPVKSVLIAAGAGLLLGFLFTRR
jgi:ElaB/YqjD/DUF883 family membrane-anchored ribosome-binding protein